MSVLTGKCDFYDHLVMIHGESDREKVEAILQKMKLYVRGADKRYHLVKSDTIKDIVLYYPYLVASAYTSPENGYVIQLSSDDYISTLEKEVIQSMVNMVLKYWRKCKRNKKTFNAELCLKNCGWRTYEETIRQIIERVQQYGEKATFDDIHIPTYETSRQLWFDTLIQEGYTEYEAWKWCFKEIYPRRDLLEKRLGHTI